MLFVVGLLNFKRVGARDLRSWLLLALRLIEAVTETEAEAESESNSMSNIWLMMFNLLCMLLVLRFLLKGFKDIFLAFDTFL